MLDNAGAEASGPNSLEPRDVLDLLDDLQFVNHLAGCIEEQKPVGRDWEDLAETCWGSQARASKAAEQPCTPGFVPGKIHFQHKFCPTCRAEGIHVPADCLRIIQGDADDFKNAKKAGFWNRKTDLRFRVINQANGCKSGPLLITSCPSRPQY